MFEIAKEINCVMGGPVCLSSEKSGKNSQKSDREINSINVDFKNMPDRANIGPQDRFFRNVKYVGIYY